MAFRNLRNSILLSTLLLTSLLLQSPRQHVEARTTQTPETPTTVEPDIKELTTQSPELTTAAKLILKTEATSKADDLQPTSTQPTTTSESTTEVATTIAGHIDFETER